MQEKTAGQKGGRLEKFSLTATQAILYFDSIARGRDGDGEVPAAREVSDPRADVPVAGVRVLRPGSELGGAAGAVGGGEGVRWGARWACVTII